METNREIMQQLAEYLDGHVVGEGRQYLSQIKCKTAITGACSCSADVTPTEWDPKVGEMISLVEPDIGMGDYEAIVILERISPTVTRYTVKTYACKR